MITSRMLIRDLGLKDYRSAWAIQEECHAQALAGGEETLLLVEHPPVITFGRRAGLEHQVLAPAETLAQLGVQVVQSDRGGETTFHGPGQLVAYPIIRLASHDLSVGSYMRLLQDVVVKTLAEYGIAAHLEEKTVGVWVSDVGFAVRTNDSSDGSHSEPYKNEPRTLNPPTSKIAALGVRIRRGVSLHGLALNVTTDLSYFNLINPCGLSRPVTSMQKILGDKTPSIQALKDVLAGRLQAVLSQTSHRPSTR